MRAVRFADREEAGRQLARQLHQYMHRQNVIILALPRGGIPVGAEIAEALHVPLDVLNVRKLGTPRQEEMAMGAIATGDILVMNEAVVQEMQVTDKAIEEVIQSELSELARREKLYREDRPAPLIRGKIVLLVDDGLATGATMAAAVKAVRQQRPSKIVVAVPTASRLACSQFENLVDDIVCLITPEKFVAVGEWYEDFPQLTDAEVSRLLKQTQNRVLANKADSDDQLH